MSLPPVITAGEIMQCSARDAIHQAFDDGRMELGPDADTFRIAAGHGENATICRGGVKVQDDQALGLVLLDFALDDSQEFVDFLFFGAEAVCLFLCFDLQFGWRRFLRLSLSFSINWY